MNPEALKAAIAHWQQARTLRAAGRLVEAEALYRRAAQAVPTHVDLLGDWGTLLEKLGQWKAAEAVWRQVVRLAPGRGGEGHLGLALLMLERNEQALPLLEQQVAQRPQDADALTDLGACHWRLGNDAAALDALRRAVAANPGRARPHEALVTTLLNLGRADEAGAAIDAARRAFPDNPELAFFSMEHRLKRLDFTAFDDFGTRWHTRFAAGNRPNTALPAWDGTPFAGRLLVRAEQGVGDEVLFSNVFADACARQPDIAIECDARLLPLFRRSIPGPVFVDRTAPDSDPAKAGARCQCMAGDLCRWLRRDLADFPTTPGWLRADPARVAALRAAHEARFGNALRVGIAWRSQHPSNGPAKSLRLGQLQPLLALPGARFVDLQYGDTAAERAALARDAGIEVWRDDGIDPLNDLDGAAAQIASLDLVISTSNTTVHVAGALGVPVWVLLHRDQGSLWYWGYDVERVPWYPRTTLLRCPRRGDWQPVIDEAAARLRALLAG